MRTEFDLIDRYFARPSTHRNDVVVGIGDDGAILRVPAAAELVVVMDTLVAGVHFPLYTDPASIGFKAVAVNLSDLAAMGAEPAWATLALTLPDNNEQWLSAFSEGLFAALDLYNVALVGGDTTRGPLTITIQLHGFIPEGCALRRNGAQPGDEIYITGSIGDAGMALLALEGKITPQTEHREYFMQRLNRPQARVAEGMSLRGIANAAIDISDGLLADLGHILERSHVGALINIDAVPCSDAFLAQNIQDNRDIALSSGDDYELCFTVPQDKIALFQRVSTAWSCPCTRIGVIAAELGLRCTTKDGVLFSPRRLGYQHF